MHWKDKVARAISYTESFVRARPYVSFAICLSVLAVVVIL